MDDLLPELQEDFNRRAQEIGEEQYNISSKTIGIYDVLRAHYLIVDFFVREGKGIGGVFLRDINLLHSALSRQTTGYDGKTKWIEELDRNFQYI
jgi:hypothetical protein